MSTTLQFVDEITVENPQAASSSVRVLTRLYFATFWAILLTGAIRKWLFPGVTALYLLQDLPMGLAYVYALWKGLFDRGQMMLVYLLLATLLILQALVQIIFAEHNPLVAFIGLHNYLFYWPMLLVFPVILTLESRRRLIWWSLIASIPMSALALAQNAMPKTAWINKTSEGDAFGVSGADVARVSGTFNFTLYYGIWVSIVVAFCMGEWLLPKHRRVFKNTWLLVLCTFTVNLCHLVSASRSAIMLSGIAIFGGLVAALVLRSTRAIAAIAGIFFLLPILGAMTYAISPEEFNVLVERFTSQDNVTEGRNRIALIAIGYVTEPKISLTGAGIGMGVDAAHIGSANAYSFAYDLSEFDTIRVVMELGTPVGYLYLLARFGLIVAMMILALRIVREGSSPHVLPLSFCLMAETYMGDLTRSATMTSSQIFFGYTFILGAYYYPDNTTTVGDTAGNLLMRSE